MEKGSPHYALERIKEEVAQAGVRAFTRSALDGGAEMGLSSAGLLAAVLSVKRSMFYKSMTTYQDHRVWQDVYHVPTPVGMA